MTSKTPARTMEDIDDKALTYGEELFESIHEQALDSYFTSTVTKDGKYIFSF